MSLKVTNSYLCFTIENITLLILANVACHGAHTTVRCQNERVINGQSRLGLGVDSLQNSYKLNQQK